MLGSITQRNCSPEIKTLNYLKKNLLYCFEPQTRGSLKEQIEKLEDNFFTAATIAAANAANIDTEELKATSNKLTEKRQARRSARKGATEEVDGDEEAG